MLLVAYLALAGSLAYLAFFLWAEFTHFVTPADLWDWWRRGRTRAVCAQCRYCEVKASDSGAFDWYMCHHPALMWQADINDYITGEQTGACPKSCGIINAGGNCPKFRSKT